MDNKSSAVYTDANPTKGAEIMEKEGTGIVYSYLRFSSAPQEQGFSIVRQTKLLEAYLKETGFTVDEEFRLEDRGIGGYRGRNSSEGELSLFLKAIEEGRTLKGANFVCENLDRFTRLPPLQALNLLQRIIIEGDLTFITLEPRQMINSEILQREPWALQGIVSEFIRGNKESERKSYFSTKNFNEKRDKSRQDRTPYSPKCPSWLKLNDQGKFIFDNKKKKTVLDIIGFALEGSGTTDIVKKLNRSKTPVIATLNGEKKKSHTWHRSYIHKILRDRRLIGEINIGKYDGKKSNPTGEILKDYYPAVIDEKTFYKLQAILDKRITSKGRKSKTAYRNLFVGLCRDARDGKTLQTVHKGRKSEYTSFVSGASRRGEQQEYIALKYELIEWLILLGLTQVKVTSPNQHKEQMNIKAKEAELRTIEQKIKKIEEQIEGEDDIAVFAKLLKKQNEEMKTVKKEIETLKRASNLNEGKTTWQEFYKFYNKMEATKGEELEELRIKLKSKVSTLIDDIWILPIAKGKYTRQALIQINFPNIPPVKLWAETGRSFEGEDGRKEILKWDCVDFPDLKNWQSLDEKTKARILEQSDSYQGKIQEFCRVWI